MAVIANRTGQNAGFDVGLAMPESKPESWPKLGPTVERYQQDNLTGIPIRNVQRTTFNSQLSMG
jgi:hypothetical protein